MADLDKAPRLALYKPTVAGSWACPDRKEEPGHWLFAGRINVDTLPMRCHCGKVMLRV